MSSNPPVPPKGKLDWSEIIADLPAFEEFVAACVAAANAEKTAKTWTDRVAIMIPVEQKAAAIVDTIIAQLAT